MNNNTKNTGLKDVYENIYENDAKLLQIEQQKSIDFEEKRYLGRNNKSQNNQINPKKRGTVNVITLFGDNSVYRLRSELNPCANFRREYLVLDTLNRVPNDRTGVLQWNYISTNVYEPTAVSTKTPIRDLVGMRIYPIHLHGNLGNSGRYGNWVFSILIEEFKEQSFIAHQDSRFHFLMRGTNSVPPDLTPMNDGFFWFAYPITTINTLTVTIANPLVENNIISTVTQLNDPAYVTVTTTTIQVSLAFNPNFAVGDVFNFDGWTTTNPIADSAAIATINRFTGLPLLSGTSTLLFQISPPIAPLVGALSGTRFVIYNETLRIIFPLELIFIDPKSNEIDD